MAKKYFKGGVSRDRVSGLDFKDFRQFLTTQPGVISDRVADKLEVVGEQGVELMRDVINKSVTPTGSAAQAAGLRTTAGRVRGPAERKAAGASGKSMYEAVTYRVNRNTNNITLAIGWLSGRPGYAFFQEYGTSNGVQGMDSLGEVSLWLESHVRRGLI